MAERFLGLELFFRWGGTYIDGVRMLEGLTLVGGIGRGSKGRAWRKVLGCEGVKVDVGFQSHIVDFLPLTCQFRWRHLDAWFISLKSKLNSAAYLRSYQLCFRLFLEPQTQSFSERPAAGTGTGAINSDLVFERYWSGYCAGWRAYLWDAWGWMFREGDEMTYCTANGQVNGVYFCIGGAVQRTISLLSSISFNLFLHFLGKLTKNSAYKLIVHPFYCNSGA